MSDRKFVVVIMIMSVHAVILASIVGVFESCKKVTKTVGNIQVISTTSGLVPPADTSAKDMEKDKNIETLTSSDQLIWDNIYRMQREINQNKAMTKRALEIGPVKIWKP